MPLTTERDLHRDPYPGYARLRQSGPVQWSTQFCGGAWLLTAYDDVALALRDPRFSVQRAGGWINSSDANKSGIGRSRAELRAELREFKRIFARSLLFMDGPQHTRVRQAMQVGFKPGRLQTWAPRIRQIVDTLLDKITNQSTTNATTNANSNAKPEQAGCELMAQFARPLPALVIAAMLGIDRCHQSEQADFVGWSDEIAAFIGSPTPTLELAWRAQTALVAMEAFFIPLIAQRRQDPGDDLLSLLIQAERNGEIITTKELLAQCCTFLFAGHETTRNLLGNGLLAFLQHPTQWQQLQAQPALMSSALRELLRYDSPVQYTGRRLKTDIDLHGFHMKKGDLVLPLIGAANRDPHKFTDPDRLDIARNEGNHLSFGYGPHVCIGATLTYLEAQIAFEGLMQRLPLLQLRDTAPPVWHHNPVYRGLETLSLQFALASPPSEISTHA
ncbi:cytochrome P450 [Herbaspirillum sp. RTI4]|uniref:cytochrome P450 n=1 Tax=Herbaspirillum sp. RTI4 TaxID=3048640 RepID=UPI002AB59F48|nr:cytochrome P450 [Herbaspirillum sp. RTI4]MDY7579108.1 cytochrome P450 [Herbaspirillum sp. RTI4]MEA9981313.1 cytochrome P450 [Herbaspirillum sp. RTI4]